VSTQQIIEAWETGIEPYTLDQTESLCQWYDEQEHRWWEEHAAGTQAEVKERMRGGNENNHTF